MLFIGKDIIKDDLLKNISERFDIEYKLLLEELDKIRVTRSREKSKYSCDNDFFGRDNEASFYWAGFMAADGCLFKKMNSKSIHLQLAEKDKAHVELFKEHVNFNGKIVRNVSRRDNPKWKDSVRFGLSINSNKMFEDLERFNLKPNKSLTYEFPQFIKNSPYLNHFLRGYIDGDGCFYWDKSRNRVCFELRGTENCMTNFLELIENNCGIGNNTEVTHPDATFKIKLSGKKYMFKIVDYLYKDATIFLQRKYDIAKMSYDAGKRKTQVHQ